MYDHSQSKEAESYTKGQSAWGITEKRRLPRLVPMAPNRRRDGQSVFLRHLRAQDLRFLVGYQEDAQIIVQAATEEHTLADTPIAGTHLFNFGSGKFESYEHGHFAETEESPDPNDVHKKLQSAITRQLEEREARAVFNAYEAHHEHVATAASLAILVAYKVNRKKGNNGQTLFSGWPSADRSFCRPAWYSCTARYYGAECPVASRIAGKRWRSPWRKGEFLTCDRYGHIVSSLSVPGGGFTKRHDTVKFPIKELALSFDCPARTEIHGVFADLFTDAELHTLETEAAQDGSLQFHGHKGQGIIPDLKMQTRGSEELFELKALGYVKSWYPTHGGTATKQNTHPETACNRRAAKVHGDYVTHARKLDVRFRSDQIGTGNRPEGVGPFEERLNEFGQVRPLVFGPFADVNSEFNVVIKEMAVQGAKKMWNTMLCKTPEDAVGILMWRARVYLGKAILHANANFLLNQVRGMTEDDRSTRHVSGRTTIFGPYGAPSVMMGHANRRRSHAGSRLLT